MPQVSEAQSSIIEAIYKIEPFSALKITCDRWINAFRSPIHNYIAVATSRKSNRLFGKRYSVARYKNYHVITRVQ